MPMTSSEITDVARQRRNDSRLAVPHRLVDLRRLALCVAPQQEPRDAAECARDQRGDPARRHMLHAVLQAAFVVAERGVLHVEQDRHHQRAGEEQAAMPVSTTITQNRGVRTPAPPLVMFGCSIAPRPDGRRCSRLRPPHALADPGRSPIAHSAEPAPWARAARPAAMTFAVRDYLPGRRAVIYLVRDRRAEPGCMCGGTGRALARSHAGKAPDVPAPGEQHHPLRGGHRCLRHTPTVSFRGYQAPTGRWFLRPSRRLSERRQPTALGRRRSACVVVRPRAGRWVKLLPSAALTRTFLGSARWTAFGHRPPPPRRGNWRQCPRR